MDVSPKKRSFYAGLLMQRSLDMSPGYIPNTSPKLADTDKAEGGLLVPFPGLCFFIASLPGKFSVNALAYRPTLACPNRPKSKPNLSL